MCTAHLHGTVHAEIGRKNTLNVVTSKVSKPAPQRSLVARSVSDLRRSEEIRKLQAMRGFLEEFLARAQDPRASYISAASTWGEAGAAGFSRTPSNLAQRNEGDEGAGSRGLPGPGRARPGKAPEAAEAPALRHFTVDTFRELLRRCEIRGVGRVQSASAMEALGGAYFPKKVQRRGAGTQALAAAAERVRGAGERLEREKKAAGSNPQAEDTEREPKDVLFGTKAHLLAYRLQKRGVTMEESDFLFQQRYGGLYLHMDALL